jgi:hypothetical protein
MTIKQGGLYYCDLNGNTFFSCSSQALKKNGDTLFSAYCIFAQGDENYEHMDDWSGIMPMRVGSKELGYIHPIADGFDWLRSNPGIGEHNTPQRCLIDWCFQ